MKTTEEIDEGELVATCPACGHTGPEERDFSWLAAGFNGVERGEAEDLNVLECGRCRHKFDPDEQGAATAEAAPTFARSETVGLIRAAARTLNAEDDGAVFFPNWDGSDGEQGALIRDAARAAFGGGGIEGGRHTSKRAVAALIHYLGDMLEE